MLEEAALEALEAERAAVLQWLAEVMHLRDGTDLSKGSLAVLIELRARGYQISSEGGVITIAISGRCSSHVRSNEDIERIGNILLKTPQET